MRCRPEMSVLREQFPQDAAGKLQLDLCSLHNANWSQKDCPGRVGCLSCSKSSFAAGRVRLWAALAHACLITSMSPCRVGNPFMPPPAPHHCCIAIMRRLESSLCPLMGAPSTARKELCHNAVAARLEFKCVQKWAAGVAADSQPCLPQNLTIACAALVCACASRFCAIVSLGWHHTNRSFYRT